MGTLGYLILIPLGFWLLVSASGFLPLVLLRFSNFSKVEDAVPIFDRALGVLDPVWIQETRFRGQCAIRPLGIQMALFLSEDRKIAMAVYFAGGHRVVDFVSSFPGGVSVTTSSTIDGPCAPAPPGTLIQSFKNKSPDELLRIHMQGVVYLQNQLKMGVRNMEEVQVEMEKSIKRQVNYIACRPWHILTMPYRYAVLRFARMNLTLEQQQQKGVFRIEKLKQQTQAGMGKAKAA